MLELSVLKGCMTSCMMQAHAKFSLAPIVPGVCLLVSFMHACTLGSVPRRIRVSRDVAILVPRRIRVSRDVTILVPRRIRVSHDVTPYHVTNHVVALHTLCYTL